MFLHPGSLLSTPFSSFPSKFGPHVAWAILLCTFQISHQRSGVWSCLCGILVVGAPVSAVVPPINFSCSPQPRTPRVFRPLVPTILFAALLLGLL